MSLQLDVTLDDFIRMCHQLSAAEVVKNVLKSDENDCAYSSNKDEPCENDNHETRISGLRLYSVWRR